jgi:hypothetical protein
MARSPYRSDKPIQNKNTHDTHQPEYVLYTFIRTREFERSVREVKKERKKKRKMLE